MQSETPPLYLKLYVTGETPSSRQAIENLQQTLDSEYPGHYQLDVIDILQRPQLAEEEKILATPALIKDLPPPVRRIVGDLADREKVLLGLDIRSGGNPSSTPGGSE
ncbi:MAG: circadian clock protein KaiB [Pseudomonadota bacterium]